MNGEVYLFVYGTLRRGTRSAMHDWLTRHAQYVGPATYQGRLYQIDYYPGVVPSDDPADIVHGEVYRLRHPERVFERLDQYEGCTPDSAEPAEFVRKLQTVRLRDGSTVRAWVYLYNHPTHALERIPTGDFLDRAATGDKGPGGCPEPAGGNKNAARRDHGERARTGPRDARP